MNRFATVTGILLVLLCASAPQPLRAQTANAIVPVTLGNTLAANDDDSTDAVPLGIGGANGINFYGQSFTQVYVNNNGNLTFGNPLSQFTPNGLAQGVGSPIIAAFFADVDTTGTGSGLVQYGNATVNGLPAFVANYINVGYFSEETDKLNSFQLALIDRSDTGAGNFDIEFNYNQILWETGDASGGTDGLGGTSAAVGYSNGLSGSANVYFQLTGSLVNGALINGGPDALISHSINSSVPGRYIFPVRQGQVTLLLSSVTCLPGILAQGAVSTCTITLTGNAPAGAVTSVTLSSSSSSLSVPASVTVPAGQSTATFTVTAAGAIASNQAATVTATFGGNSQTATINLTNAVQSGYIGVFYFSTPPSPCPTALTTLCAANTAANNDPKNDTGGTPIDAPVFVFVNTSTTPITGGVLTIVGIDSFDLGTIAANSSVTVVPGVSDDGQNHGSDNFFTVTGTPYDSSDNFPSLNSTPFKFTGLQGGTQIVSVDICGILAAPIFTPACTAGPSNDGGVTTPPFNFLGGPGDNDSDCENCFGPAIVADLGTFAPASTSGVSITTTSLSNTTVLTPGSQTFSATGGTAPYTWTLVGGSLPPGMALASSGTLSGVATKPGSYTFTVRVTDTTGAFSVETVSITVAAQSVTVTTPSPLPSGMVTVQYPLQVLSASGGVAPYTFSVPANSLPDGLTLSSGGAISGTPAATGTFTFTLTATDSAGQTGTKSMTITVRPFAPDLLTFAGSLSFTLAAGTATLPGPQTVQVESTDVTKILSWSTAITPVASWLSITSGGTTPGSFNVALTSSASQLSASATPYQTTITVACLAPSPCAGNSQSVSVSLLVSTLPAQLTVLTNLLSFNTSSASPLETTQTLGIENAGGGTLTLTSITCPETWCVPAQFPASLGAGGVADMSIQANPAGLSPGFYFTNLTVVSSAGTAVVPVTFLIAANASLTLNPSGTQLSMPTGGVAANPDTSFQVSVSGTAPVAWTATVLPGAPWLNLATTSGSSTNAAAGSVAYSVDQSAAAVLAPQAYYGTIRVASTGVVNSPQDFQVVLNVTSATSSQTPNPTPAGLIFITSAGTAPLAQIDQVFASSSAPVSYQASAATANGVSWLSVSPATGTTSAASPAQTSISVNPAGLAAGVYQGTVSYSLAAASVPTVNVTLIVEPSGGSSERPANVPLKPASSSSCTPSQIVPTQNALVTNFAAPAAWPTQLQIQLNDNCGNAISNGQVVATFSNGDPPLVLGLVNTSSGLYSGTWTPQNTGSQVTVTARATAPGFSAATEQISGSVVPNAAPMVFPNGTVQAFTPQSGAPLAPGTWVAIYGSGLAPQTLVNSTIPFATNLAGTSVIIGGLQAPLYFVSTGQVNALVPFELPAGQTYQVIVNNNGALSTPQSFQATTVTPGIANYASGFAEAEHAVDGSLITEASPAKPGEYVVLYLVGMGPTTVPVTSGLASPTTPLDTTVTQDAPTITLNGEPVPVVLFSGLTPTAVGLYQIDIQVPADAPNGDLTLVVNQPGFEAVPVILPVHD